MGSHVSNAGLKLQQLSVMKVVLPSPIVVLGIRPVCVALVGAMIGRNASAFECPQLNLFSSDTLEGMLKARLDARQTHIHGLLRAVAYMYGGEQTINSVAMARRWVLRRLSWSTSQVFDELRKQVAPRKLVDKSPIYSQNKKCLERIQKSYPDAYYVHVVEHPLTSFASITSAKHNEALYPGPRAGGERSREDQLQWLNAQRLIAEATGHVMPERLVVIRVETLFQDSRSELSRLCTRLDLATDERSVDDMLHPENSPFASLGPVGANVGDDPTFLSDPTFLPQNILATPFSSRHPREHMLPEVAEAAAQYGYG